MSVRNRTPALPAPATYAAVRTDPSCVQPAPALDDPEAYCHLLDERGRALCFADIAGRRVHTTAECERDGHWQCGRCITIAMELDVARSWR